MVTVDAHCDTLLKVQGQSSLYDLGAAACSDLKRLSGNIDLQVFAVFVESRFKPYQSLQRGLQLIETFYQEMDKNREYVKVVTTKEDLSTLGNDARVHALLAVEGGEIICGDLSLLSFLFRSGVRSIGLTWNQRNEIADGCGDGLSGGGLTAFGRKVVEKMNDLGMVVDVAHISERGFWSVLEHSPRPVMVSHANCRRLCPHVRNLSDGQIKALAEHHGVMGITFVPDFLNSGPVSQEDVLRHIDHAVSLVGPDYVGLGSDFDGTDLLPVGLEDATKVLFLAEDLAKRGYKSSNIEKIMGKNFLRLFEEILPTGEEKIS